MKRFVDNDNGTVTDTETGLIWQKDHAGPMSWTQAMDYASKLELAGYTDWRLPTIKELITLIDFGKHDPASNFPGMPSEWFWSSSPYAPYSVRTWYVNFNFGSVHNDVKYFDYYVRCVRG